MDFVLYGINMELVGRRGREERRERRMGVGKGREGVKPTPNKVVDNG